MMNRIKYLLKWLAVVCNLILVARVAQGMSFTNGSFEIALIDPDSNWEGVLTLGIGDTSITGWTVLSGTIDYISTYWQPSDGSRSVDMNGASADAGAISQTFDTTLGAQYEVRFDLAGNPNGGPTIKPLRVAVANAFADYTFNITGRSVANMGYEEEIFLFTAVAPTTTLTFTSLTSGCCFGPALDNVRVTAVSTPIPESASLVLVCTGLFGLGIVRAVQHT